MKPSHFLGAITLLSIALLPTPGSSQNSNPRGTVYAMTNADDGNQVVAYERAADGTLTLIDTYSTGGSGLTSEPNDALGSQNPLVLSPDGKWLFAVNAGSNTISTFRVRNNNLELVDVTDSGGDFPASLAILENLVYVLNAGGDGNIAGFRLRPNGRLVPLAGSTRTLDAAGDNPPFFLVSPAQVGFSPRGDSLVVTVKGMHPVHQIHLFAIDVDGLPSEQPATTTSDNTLSFGFVFDTSGNLIVAEPFGNQFTGTPAPDLSAASSYRLASDGSLTQISTSIANGQTATCWIAITPDGRFAYTTNNESGTLSSYSVAADGSLSLLHAVAATSGAHPVDLAITSDGGALYNVNAGDGTVGMYRINRTDGSLISLGVIGGLPDNGSAVGIATSIGASGSCFPIRGHYDEHVKTKGCNSPVDFCIAGEFHGVIRGGFFNAVTSFTQTADTAITGVVHFTADSVIHANVHGKRGDLMIKNSGAFHSVGEGNIVDLQIVTDGSGELTGASGAIRASGLFDPEAGAGYSEYEGEICLP